MNGRIELTFTPVPRCAIRKFGYLQKLRYSLCNFVPNYVLINYFAAACRSRCQHSSSSTAELVDDTYKTIGGPYYLSLIHI